MISELELRARELREVVGVLRYDGDLRSCDLANRLEQIVAALSTPAATDGTCPACAGTGHAPDAVPAEDAALWMFVEQAYDNSKTSRSERILECLNLPTDNPHLPLARHIWRFLGHDTPGHGPMTTDDMNKETDVTPSAPAAVEEVPDWRETLERLLDGLFSKHHNAQENGDAYDEGYFAAMMADVQQLLDTAPPTQGAGVDEAWASGDIDPPTGVDVIAVWSQEGEFPPEVELAGIPKNGNPEKQWFNAYGPCSKPDRWTHVPDGTWSRDIAGQPHGGARD